MVLNEKGIYKWVSDPKIQSVLLKEIFSGMVVIRGLRWAVWVINLNLSAKRIGSSVFFHLSSMAVQKWMPLTRGGEVGYVVGR